MTNASQWRIQDFQRGAEAQTWNISRLKRRPSFLWLVLTGAGGGPRSPVPPPPGSAAGFLIDAAGADLGGPWGPGPPPDPLYWGPNFCRHRDSAARCRQNLGWATPLTQILDPHLCCYVKYLNYTMSVIMHVCDNSVLEKKIEVLLKQAICITVHLFIQTCVVVYLLCGMHNLNREV